MIKKFIVFLLLVYLFYTVSGCKSEDKQPLATVYGNNLYVDDIKDYFDFEMNEKDSLELLKRLVQEWVDNKVKLENAKKFESVKFDEMANEYKQNLMIAAFLEQYVQNNLDTVLNEAEMLDYYNKNKQNFLLNKNILKLIFVKIDAENNNIQKIKKLINNAGESDIEKLAKLCEQYASNYFLDYNIWLDFEDVVKEIPIKTYDVEQFLQNNKYFEIKDGSEVYLIRIIDYKIRNTESEFEFEKANIKKVLLNSRRINLIKQFETSLLEEAKNTNNVKIYLHD